MRAIPLLAAGLLMTALSSHLLAGPHDGAVWVWQDTFDTYATGNLGDVSGGVWGGGVEFQVISGGCPQNPTRCVETTGATSTKSPAHSFNMAWEPKGGTLYYHCRIMSPRGQSGGTGATFSINIRDENYLDIALWEADERTVTPYTGDGSVSGTSTSLVAGTWYELDIVHDVFTKETKWYVDGVLKLSFNLRDLANKDFIPVASVKWLMFRNYGPHPTYKLQIDDVKLGAKYARSVPEIWMPSDACSVGGSGPFVYSPFDCATEFPTITWKVDPHIGYHVKIFEFDSTDPDNDPYFDGILQPNVTKQHFTTCNGVTLVANQTYWVRVRVKINGVWQAWSPGGRDFAYNNVYSTKPQAPVINSPANGAWVRPLHTLPTLSWAVGGSVPHNQARVVMGTSSGEDDYWWPEDVGYWDSNWLVIGDSLNLNALSPRPRNLVEDQVYYTRVRVRNGCEGCDEGGTPYCDSNGPFSSSTYRFRATNKPIVSQASPAGGVQIHTATPTITWPADIGVVAPVTQVQVRVNSESDATPLDGAKIKYDTTFAVSGDPGYHTVASALPTGTALWAFVRLCNSAGWGPWSPNTDGSNWPAPVDPGWFFINTSALGMNPVTNFTATKGNGQITLAWHTPSDASFSGTLIRYKTTGYPTSATDGTLVIDEPGAPNDDENYVHTGLTNGTTYYYSAFAHDATPTYSTKSYASATPSASDTTAPAVVSEFAAVAGSGQVALSWRNPADADFAGVMIRYKTGTYPSGPTDGTLVIDKAGTPATEDSHTHTGLANGTTCYYRAYSHDDIPNYSSGASASATPTAPDTVSPANVSSFAATAGAGQVTLSWLNPSDVDYTGTMIRYKTTGYPTSTTDGTFLADKSGLPSQSDSWVHTNCIAGTTYYYKAYAHDGVPNHASGATASATPSGAVTVPTLAAKEALSITVDGNSSDWNLGDFATKVRGGQLTSGDYALVGYDGATCYYAGYWTDGVLPTSASDHTAKVYCRHSTSYIYFLVRCDDDDMRYSNPLDSNWANDCVEFYIDPSHNHGASPISSSTSDVQLVIDAANQKNVYMCTDIYRLQVMAGTTSAVVRDATGWWLEARVAKSALEPDIPADGTFGIDFSFRDNDNNNDPTKTTAYTWADNSSGSGFPTKIPNKWGDVSLPDITPPGSVSSFVAAAGDEQVALSWHNPPDSDFTGTMIRYKTTGFPYSEIDGTLVIDKPNSPNTDDNYVHSGLTNGTTYYYAAFAHDAAVNYATKVNASAVPADTIAPGPATSFGVVVGNERNFLEWTNPADPDFAGVKVLFKTTGYPSSPSDGTVTYQGTDTSYTHASLINGTTYYYAAYAYDEVPNYSTAAQANGTPAYVTPAGAKLLGDGTELTMTVGVVSALFADSFYVQCVDPACGVCGVKVVKPGHGMQIGQSATVRGTVMTDGATGERYISATWAK